MNQNAASRQPELFDMDEHPSRRQFPHSQEQLATLAEALLCEIIAALATEEVGDDQYHG